MSSSSPRRFEVDQEGGDRPVGPPAHGRVILLDVVVGVPAVHVARVELDEPHAPLDQPPCQQAPRAELRRLLLVEPVEPADLLRLAREVHGLGRGGLHPVGQLVGADPGLELGVLAPRFEVAGVEPADQVEGLALAVGGHRVGRAEVEDRALAGPDHGPLVGRRAGSPAP